MKDRCILCNEDLTQPEPVIHVHTDGDLPKGHAHALCYWRHRALERFDQIVEISKDNLRLRNKVGDLITQVSDLRSQLGFASQVLTLKRKLRSTWWSRLVDSVKSL
jgi:hypothetical protein